MPEIRITNVSVAPVHREPTFGSEIISTTYLWEQLDILETKDDWYRVRQEDRYSGWVAEFYLVGSTHRGIEQNYRSDNLVFPLHEGPQSNSAILRDATFLSRFPVTAREGEWVRLALPDGLEGWTEDRPRPLSPTPEGEAILQLATRCLGIQYSWGGKTPKGFDCSGFVQTVFQLNGMSLPRDSYVQAQLGQELPDDFNTWETGDLIFFSSKGGRITHVAISMGGGDFIHSSGYVRINSLDPEHGDLFSPRLQNNFVKATRVLGVLSSGITETKQETCD